MFAGHLVKAESTPSQLLAAIGTEIEPGDIPVKEERVDYNLQVDAVPLAAPGSVAVGPSIPGELIAKADETILSQQQQTILQKILAGENYFFTGSAGTGKSVLLRAIIDAFKRKVMESRRDHHAFVDKRWQEYLQNGAQADAHQEDPVLRWNLGVTASTGMAGV